MQPVEAASVNMTNMRLLPRPTQLHTKGQWWSMLTTHMLHFCNRSAPTRRDEKSEMYLTVKLMMNNLPNSA